MMGLDLPPPTSANTYGLNSRAKSKQQSWGWMWVVPYSAIASLDYVQIHLPKTSALKHEDALWLRRWCVVPPLLFTIARVRDISWVIVSGITIFLSASAETAF